PVVRDVDHSTIEKLHPRVGAKSVRELPDVQPVRPQERAGPAHQEHRAVSGVVDRTMTARDDPDETSSLRADADLVAPLCHQAVRAPRDWLFAPTQEPLATADLRDPE